MKTCHTLFLKFTPIAITCFIVFTSACSHKKEVKEEQITVSETETSNLNDTNINSIQGNITLKQIASNPSEVILTGLPDQRLVTIYKSKSAPVPKSSESSYSYYDENGNESEELKHFMPGIDILYGYNLLNIAHYDFKTEKLNYFFDHPVLVKTLYYPCFEQDSLNKKPINRDYYLVSAYDEDSNKDSLINKKDLRRFFFLNATCISKTMLITSDYSVVRSQYDSQNYVIYLFVKQDANKNGTIDKEETMHIFWVNLKNPLQAKRMY